MLRGKERLSEESETVISATSVEEEDDSIINGRKKLRLTKAESALLEQAFKHHSTLNSVGILYLSHTRTYFYHYKYYYYRCHFFPYLFLLE